LLGNDLHRKETRIVIADKVYDESRIVSAYTSGSLFSKVGIGNCVSRSVKLEIFPQDQIPRQAKIEIYVRISVGATASEWIPKGVFYIDTRQTDSSTGMVTINGYDAMLKAEQVYLDNDPGFDWPMDMASVANSIAERMGVTIDARSNISSNFLVEYPLDYTMREILGYIAVAHAGNWIITDAGELRLVRLVSLPAETNYLVNQNGDTITFGSTKILIS